MLRSNSKQYGKSIKWILKEKKERLGREDLQKRKDLSLEWESVAAGDVELDCVCAEPRWRPTCSTSCVRSTMFLARRLPHDWLTLISWPRITNWRWNDWRTFARFLPSAVLVVVRINSTSCAVYYCCDFSAQCYLPPGRGDISALTPAAAGTRFSDPKGMQDRLNLVNWLHTSVAYLLRLFKAVIFLYLLALPA